jgi:hypothetical protein
MNTRQPKAARYLASIIVTMAFILVVACGEFSTPQGIPPEQATIWALNTQIALQQTFNNLTMTAIANAGISNTSNSNTNSRPVEITETPAQMYVEPTSSTINAKVKTRNVRLREGPDLRFPSVGDLSVGTICTISGRYGDGWFQVLVLVTGKRGWLFIAWLEMPPVYDINTIPIIPKSALPASCRKYCN